MKEYLGTSRFCEVCKHSTTKQDDIICDNKNSKFNGLKVNSVLCAPCRVVDKGCYSTIYKGVRE